MKTIDLTRTVEPFYMDNELPQDLVVKLSKRLYNMTRRLHNVKPTKKRCIVKSHTSEKEHDVDFYRTEYDRKIYKLYFVKSISEDIFGYEFQYIYREDSQESFFCDVFCVGGCPTIIHKDFSFYNSNESAEFNELTAIPTKDIYWKVLQYGLLQIHWFIKKTDKKLYLNQQCYQLYQGIQRECNKWVNQEDITIRVEIREQKKVDH